MAAYLASLNTGKLWVLCLQLVRDAEMLNPSEVAVLPVVLMQLYKQRSGREQAAVVTHAFFEGLIKPWALEPSKLPVQVRIVPQENCLPSCIFPKAGVHIGCLLLPSTLMLSAADPAVNVNHLVRKLHVGRYSAKLHSCLRISILKACIHRSLQSATQKGPAHCKQPTKICLHQPYYGCL